MAVMIPRETSTDQRLDKLEVKVDALEKKVDEGFAKADESFNRLEDRFDALNRTLIGSAAMIVSALIGLLATQI